MLGFPIRTSPDQRSVANSPGHIAGSNVLHRLSMPRHPPCALNNLPTTNHQHTQTTHPTKEASVRVYQQSSGTNRLREHTKRSIITKQHITHTHQPHTQDIKPKGGDRKPRAGGCSRPLSRSQTTRSQPAPPPRTGMDASDASDTQQRVIRPNTHHENHQGPAAGINDCLCSTSEHPKPRRHIRPPIRVCSLERR